VRQGVISGMGKTEKKVEKPEAVEAVEKKMKALEEIRATLEAGSKGLATAITKMDLAELATMRLHPLLVEAAEAGSAAAIEAVVLAAGEKVLQVFGKPDGDLAKKVIRAVGHQFEKSKVVLDEASNPVGLSQLMLECVRNEPRSSGSSTFLRALIAAGADTTGFVNTVVRSDLDFQTKMQALFTAKNAALYDDAFQIVEKETISALTGSDRFYRMDESGRKAFGAAAKAYRDRYGSTTRLVEAVAAVHECECLSALVIADPGSFDLASKLVLERGSPRALATFYRNHKDRCDKKEFHSRLSEALKPDPDAMADMILDGGHVHPAMLDMMHGGPFFGPPPMWTGRQRRW
jgi:hypothetical protein